MLIRLVFSLVLLVAEGETYYSIAGDSTRITYQSGSDADVRTQFVTNGFLSNTQDTNFRAINDKFPVFGLAKDLGTVTASGAEPVVFSIGNVRDPAVEYIVADNNTQERNLYFWSQYSNADDAVRLEVSAIFLDVNWKF